MKIYLTGVKINRARDVRSLTQCRQRYQLVSFYHLPREEASVYFAVYFGPAA